MATKTICFKNSSTPKGKMIGIRRKLGTKRKISHEKMEIWDIECIEIYLDVGRSSVVYKKLPDCCIYTEKWKPTNSPVIVRRNRPGNKYCNAIVRGNILEYRQIVYITFMHKDV